MIGSGPAGVYASEALLEWSDSHDESGRGVVVDLIDRLPVPYGLLRHGVAPDHPRIKGIARTLEGIAQDPRIRFLGNVEFGTDLTLADVRRLYHAVVFATGALTDRTMGIPGEDLAGSFGAAEFVTWYDGHPDVDPDFPLTARRAAVVGVGNVALDVARMLVRTPEQLEATDIPEHVREGFAGNTAQIVSVVGRRGPVYAKFTPLELREMAKIEGVTVVVDPDDLDYDDDNTDTPAQSAGSRAARELRESDRRVGQVCAQLEKWAGAQRDAGLATADEAEAAALAAGDKVVRFRFNRAPVEIVGGGEAGAGGRSDSETDGGAGEAGADARVTALRLEITEPTADGGVRGTGRTEDLPVDAVFRAVGYRSSSLEGVPFADRTATIPHDEGRVLDSPGGDPIPGLFTAGWVKRGPTGVIGTNRSCAVETVGHLTEDLAAGTLPDPADGDPQAVRELLLERGVEVVDGPAWLAIDEHEKGLGEAAGRERTKLPNRAAMIDVAGGLSRCQQ
ncbi:glutamate synthase [Dietzia sp. NCCP-2495]|nr:glutamate synthase [Dietzia sp. NCCP-2495]